MIATNYDNLNRKNDVRETTSTGAVLAAWTYDTLAKGQLTSSTSYVGSVAGTPGLAYTKTIGGYDNAYRPLSTTTSIPVGADAFGGSSYTESLTYFPDGSPDTLSLPAVGGMPSESLRSLYSLTGRQSGLRSATNSYLGGIGYSSIGQLAQFSRPGPAATISSYGYDRATGLVTVLSDATLVSGSYVSAADRSYVRDLAGNVTSVTTAAAGLSTNTQCFTYDYLQNLTSAWTPSSNSCVAAPTSTTIGGPAPYWTTYTVNSTTGNRSQTVSKPVTSSGLATTQNYTYPTAGTVRPHSVSTVATQVGSGTIANDSYGYDNAGNTTTRPGQVLEYNALGLLKKTTIGTATQKNVYDADGGLLLRADSSSGNILYLGMTELRTAAGSTVVAGIRTYSAQGVPVAERTTQPGVSGSVVRWLTSDLVGTSQLEIHNTTGVQTRRYADPFGKAQGTVPAWSSDHGYLNAPSSTTTGLTHLGAREYDPSLGRFTTVDSILSPGNPQQNNGYSYAGNNPVTRSDPAGNCYQNYATGNYEGVGCGSGGSTPNTAATPPRPAGSPDSSDPPAQAVDDA